QQQRHLDQRIEQRPAVLDVPVLQELLAVVGDQDHQRVCQEAAPLQLGQQQGELGVEIGDLVVVQIDQVLHVAGSQPEVGSALGEHVADRVRVAAADELLGGRPGGEAARVIGRRRVGAVRVDEVEIEEERFVRLCAALQARQGAAGAAGGRG